MDWTRFMKWVIATHKPAEWIVAFYAISSGLWILLFDVLHSATEGVRILYGSERAWSAVPIVAGMILIVAAVFDWHRAKLVSLSVLTAFFVFTTIIFAFTNFRVAAFPAYLFSALLFAWMLAIEINRDWIRSEKSEQ
jgi:hypothetical protein